MMGIAARLRLQPYPCTLTLKTLKRGLPDDADGLTTLFDDGDIEVAIRADLDPSYKLLTCVHEAVHIARFV